MSRRRGEFEHRTSIFEGAFRAWSHLGGLSPEDLQTKTVSDLDPLNCPLINDRRLEKKNLDPLKSHGSADREYAYEPLPRTGLSHPFVQAVLSPWLGPDADNDAIQLGLTTLRTWWQHRRKGESGSARAALGTEKMKGVVEGYTRHFFTLAHCLIVNDKEPAPRSLQNKFKQLEKGRSKRNKRRSHEGKTENKNTGLNEALADTNLSPLERLHAAQRRQLQESGVVHPTIPGAAPEMTATPLINMKGKCVPGKIDLPGLESTVKRHAAQLSHHGGGAKPPVGTSSSSSVHQPAQCGDPNTFPLVFIGRNGSIQIAMKVDGITCAHCVKIVETVLKGCNGNKSPIDGLLDAAADRTLNSILIKIDDIKKANRVAYEGARNLSMVGYTATALEINQDSLDLHRLYRAYEALASTESDDIFDWTVPCQCPDNGISRIDCPRHSQMGTHISAAFAAQQQKVIEYMNGVDLAGPAIMQGQMQEQINGFDGGQQIDTLHVEPPIQPIDNYGIAPENAVASQVSFDGAPLSSVNFPAPQFPTSGQQQQYSDGSAQDQFNHSQREQAQRNPSVISFGIGVRNMSLRSEATFGRAMSGLSALAIDWENMEDFDIDVDHSAGINNHSSPGDNKVQ